MTSHHKSKTTHRKPKTSKGWCGNCNAVTTWKTVPRKNPICLKCNNVYSAKYLADIRRQEQLLQETIDFALKEMVKMQVLAESHPEAFPVTPKQMKQGYVNLLNRKDELKRSHQTKK